MVQTACPMVRTIRSHGRTACPAIRTVRSHGRDRVAHYALPGRCRRSAAELAAASSNTLESRTLCNVESLLPRVFQRGRRCRQADEGAVPRAEVKCFHEFPRLFMETVHCIARTNTPCSENGRKLLISHPSKLNRSTSTEKWAWSTHFRPRWSAAPQSAAGEVSSASGTFSPSLKSAVGRRTL